MSEGKQVSREDLQRVIIEETKLLIEKNRKSILKRAKERLAKEKKQ